MNIKKILSTLCSLTCAIGSVKADRGGARVDGNDVTVRLNEGMNDVFVRLQNDSEYKRDRSLIAAESLVKHFFIPGNYSTEGKEIIEARGIGDLLIGKAYPRILETLKRLDKDPEAKEKVLKLANSLKSKSWVEYIFRIFLTVFIGTGNASSLIVTPVAIYALSSKDAFKGNLKVGSHSFGSRSFGIFWLLVCILFWTGSIGVSKLSRSSIENWGMKRALEKLVRETKFGEFVSDRGKLNSRDSTKLVSIPNESTQQSRSDIKRKPNRKIKNKHKSALTPKNIIKK